MIKIKKILKSVYKIENDVYNLNVTYLICFHIFNISIFLLFLLYYNYFLFLFFS